MVSLMGNAALKIKMTYGPRMRLAARRLDLVYTSAAALKHGALQTDMMARQDAETKGRGWSAE